MTEPDLQARQPPAIQLGLLGNNNTDISDQSSPTSANQLEQQQLHHFPPVLSENINRSLLWLLCAQSVSLVFFVLLPVVISLPYLSDPWLNAGDLWKIFDPLFTVPLFYFILDIALQTDERSCVIETYRLNTSQSRYRLAFMIFIAIYVEGHGIHTAATIFKDPLKYLMTKQPQSAQQYPLIQQTYSYIRDDWQHVYSHYIYLIGALGVSVLHMFSYRSLKHPRLSGPLEWTLFWAASLLYGAMFAGIAVNFPYGFYATFGWLLVYAVPWCWWIWSQRVEPSDGIINGRNGWKGRMLFQPGRRLVPQFYILSYTIGLVIIFIYIGIFGFRDRATAGISLS
jgi:hypothetical protein